MAALDSTNCTGLSTPRSDHNVPTSDQDVESLVQLMTDREIESLGCVKKFVKNHQGAVNLDQRNEHGQTALMLACRERNSRVVKFLLENGADPNLRCTKEGNTALHYVCEIPEYGNTESETDDEEDWRLVTSEDEEEANGGNAALSRTKCLQFPHGVCCCSEGFASLKANDKGIHFVRLKNTKQNVAVTQKLHEEYGVEVFENDEGKLTYMFKIEKRSVTIIDLLISKYGATVQVNNDGLNPVHIAALICKRSTVQHFVRSDYIPKAEQVRALEMLGASLLLNDDYNPAYEALADAIEKRSEDLDHVMVKNYASEFEHCFGRRECQTLGDLNRIEANRKAWKEEGFLVADRVVPDALKPKYVYGKLLQHAYDILLYRTTMVKAFKVFSCCLSLEARGQLPPGHVLVFLNFSVHNAASSPSLHKLIPQYVDFLCSILGGYVEVAEKMSCARLSESVRDLLGDLSEFLYSFTKHHSRVKGIDCVLEPACKMIKAIWSKIPKQAVPDDHNWRYRRTLSVCHNVLRDVVAHFSHNYDFRSNRDICFSYKWILVHLVQVEGASYIHRNGNTMLHTLMDLVHSGELQMVLDIARLLVRHGCPTHMRNLEGKTPTEIAEEESEKLEDRHLPQLVELYSLLSPSIVPSLQELTVRTILCRGIPYKDELPLKLCELVEDNFLDDDSDAYETESGSDSSS